MNRLLICFTICILLAIIIICSCSGNEDSGDKEPSICYRTNGSIMEVYNLCDDEEIYTFDVYDHSIPDTFQCTSNGKINILNIGSPIRNANGDIIGFEAPLFIDQESDTIYSIKVCD